MSHGVRAITAPEDWRGVQRYLHRESKLLCPSLHRLEQVRVVVGVRTELTRKNREIFSCETSGFSHDLGPEGPGQPVALGRGGWMRSEVPYVHLQYVQCEPR